MGTDVGLTVIDRHYICWFANQVQSDLIGGPCTGGLCWNLFHDHPAQMDRCWACGASEAFETRRPTSRTILSHLHNGTTHWLFVQAKPIFDKRGQVIAVSEATSLYCEDIVRSMEAKDRLFAVARGLLHAGFGRVRLYSVSDSSGKKQLVAAVARSDTPDGRQYFDSLQGLELNYEECPYSREAVGGKMGVLVKSWREGFESPFTKVLGLNPPYFTIPVWNDGGNVLIGFLRGRF